MKTVAVQFSQTLKEIGIRYVFGVPSGSMIDFIEAIRQTDGIDFILVSNEASAGFMADVCGRLTGIPGACFATFGPGATNLSTGVGGALLDRSPLLAFTDEIPDHMRHRTCQMNIDHQALFKPITKWTTRLTADKVRETLYRAVQVATSEVPGSVHIGIPSGIGMKKAGDERPDIMAAEKAKPATQATLEAMHKIFSGACKPVVVAGITAVRAGIQPLFTALIEKFNVPVILTPMAKGLVPENHRLYAGVLNHALANIVGQTHQQADLIVGIGYDPVEVNYEDWIPHVPVLNINTVPVDLDMDHYTLAGDIIGDLATSLEALMAASPVQNKWDLDALQVRRKKMFEAFLPSGAFGPCTVLEGLRAALPKDGIMTCDVGAHLHLIGQMWPTPSPGCQLMTNGWSSMGFAIPSAIAAKLCRPEKKVACVVGDGGFLMMAGEMATALRLDLNIVFILLTDQRLSLIRIKQNQKLYQSGYGTTLSGAGYQSADNFFGVPILKATDKKTYDTALETAFTSTGPTIIEAFVDSEEYDRLVLKGNK